MNKPLLALPAIAVDQPIGKFFICAISAENLMKFAYSIPATMKREDGIFSNIFGNQRKKKPSRLKDIGEYIDEEDSTFPNTIILSANYEEDGTYEDDESLRWHAVRKDDGSYILYIPTDKRLASIIDGQHRVEGFSHIKKSERLNMELPCAVYINLPREYQAKIFATININQKRVDKSLAYQLFGYDLNTSDSDKWPPDMLGVYMARIFEGREKSPFKGHVKMALLEEDRPEFEKSKLNWQVSVACLVEGISRLLSDKPSLDRTLLAQGTIRSRLELPMDNAPLREMYIQGKDKSILELINTYFTVVEELLWRGQPERSFITRTVGVLALFDLLREALTAKKIIGKNVEESARAFLLPAVGVDFSDDFFQASGAGRVRIRNVLKVLTRLNGVEDQVTLAVANRLVRK